MGTKVSLRLARCSRFAFSVQPSELHAPEGGLYTPSALSLCLGWFPASPSARPHVHVAQCGPLCTHELEGDHQFVFREPGEEKNT